MVGKRSRSLFNNELAVTSVDLTETIRTKLLQLQSSAKADYLKTEVFSKFVSTDTDSPNVRRTRAINKWLATERTNEATNERILLTHPDFQILPGVTFDAFLGFCRDRCETILGATVPIEGLLGTFSGGASTSRNRTESHPALKYVGKAHVTDRAWSTFSSIAEEMPGWLGVRDQLSIEIVPGNVMFTVPKKTDIDRVACKEPDLNMFLQKGLGDLIRKSLHTRANINLNDQSINRSLARVGSIDGSLATMDLSSASDSISAALVAEILPVCWFTLLDSVRSHVTIIDGEEHRNEMFSSMGNGFTFELESLLFYLIVKAVCYFRGFRGIVSVYGDDIICPSHAFQDVEYVLGYLGFEVNTKKSFCSGPFRESCGGHYWNGTDITPFYIKAPVTQVTDVIHVANQLRKWSRIEALGLNDCEVEDLWLFLKSLVPRCLWGGVDTSFKFQLVSNDEPLSRLSEETSTWKTGFGGYFHWLNATWNRQVVVDGVSTSSASKNLNLYRLRPARPSAVNRLESHWLHEVNSSSPLR